MTRHRNKGALERTLTAMKTGGLLGEADSALVAACRSLSEAVDASPGDDRLWSRYLDALGRLRDLGGDGNDDPLADALSELQAAVRDPSPPGP